MTLNKDSTDADIRSDRWQEWRGFLEAALVELDEARMPERIAKARRFIIQRAEELTGMQGHRQERSELQDGLASLRALQSTLRNGQND